MSAAYEELIEGQAVQRAVPGVRHELIRSRLHDRIRQSIAPLPSVRLLEPRTRVPFSRNTALCPDLGLVAAANDKLWLAVEIVNSNDHRTNTVVKKQLYEELRLPRLWMIDPRYDNVEVYHASEYGLSLKCILAGREVLTEKLLPGFQIAVSELFAPSSA